MTLRVFKDLKEYYKYIESQLIKIMEEIGMETCDDLYKTVKSRIYDWTPNMYERTGELLKSVTCTKVFKENGYLYIKIYYDTDTIHPYFTDNNLFNQHSDIYGNDVSNYIPLWIEEGTEARNGNFFPRNGIHAISEELDWFTTNFVKLFKKKLKKHGILSS